MLRYDLSRLRDKIVTFANFAAPLSTLSTCKRQRAGCVVFDVDCSAVLAVGYNGPARGLPNDSCTNQLGKCGCAHAEVNAIVKLDCRSAWPALMMTTVMPCWRCANAIVNSAAICGLVWSHEYRNDLGRDLLSQARMPMLRLCDLREWKPRDTKRDEVNDTLRKWRKLGTASRRATPSEWVASSIPRL